MRCTLRARWWRKSFKTASLVEERSALVVVVVRVRELRGFVAEAV